MEAVAYLDSGLISVEDTIKNCVNGGGAWIGK
jgi:hypothetical protein